MKIMIYNVSYIQLIREPYFKHLRVHFLRWIDNMELILILFIIEFSASLWYLQIGCSSYDSSQSQPRLQPPVQTAWKMVC